MAKGRKPAQPSTCSKATSADSCGKKRNCSWDDFSQTCKRTPPAKCSALEPVQCALRMLIVGDCGMSQDGTCHNMLGE